jgi:PAS domain S-box-containing protein
LENRTEGQTDSLSLLNAILDSIADGVVAIERCGGATKVYWNTRFAAMWRIPSDLLARQDADEMVAYVGSLVKDSDQFIQLVKHQWAHPDVEQFNVVELKDGRTFERYGKALQAGGRPVGLVANFRDITESKRAEATLRENEARLLLATHASNIGPWDWDLITNQVHFSPEWKYQLGHTEDEIAGQFFEFVNRLHPDDHDRIMAAVQAYIADPSVGYDVEFRMRHKDGSYRWIHTAATLLFDASGKPIRMLGCHVDFTERKFAEERMQRLRNQHELVLRSVGEGVHWIGIDGRIKFENPTAAAMLGYDVSELLGKPAHSTMHHTRRDGADYPQSECPIYATLRDGAVRRVHDEVFWRKDGTSFPVDYSTTPICDEDGQRTGAVVLFTDNSERRQAEIEKERVSRQLIDTSRRAGMAEIATNVLHNVGNVLNSVNVSCNCLAANVRNSKVANLSRAIALLRKPEDLSDFLTADPQGRQLPGYLEQLAEHLVNEQADVLHELGQLQTNIDHIKDIVSMQQSYAKVSGVREFVNLVDLVEDMLRMRIGSMADHGVKIIREFEDVPLINTERQKILQILVNLVRNAERACSDAARPHKQVTLRIVSSDGWVRIAVIDNGVGIAPENLTRIFGHGFTTRSDGHGFGLHSSALAAKELGGALHVHSEGARRGASFVLELPL